MIDQPRILPRKLYKDNRGYFTEQFRRSDWDYDFVQDNYFTELKEAEITPERLTTLREVEEHVGTYYSREWVLRNVLRMSDEEMKEMKEQIEQEAKDAPPEEGDGEENPPVSAPSDAEEQ